MATPPRSSRPLSRDLAELHALADRDPQLGAAAALQADLVGVERKLHGRLQTTWIDVPDDDLKARIAAGRALVDFEQLPIDWNEARLVFRQVTDVLRRHDVVDADEVARLHDIGRGRTHGITHGIEGAKMLAAYPTHARVCERHIGAGLTKEEARELKLPERDFLPETLEEKIIAHADNLVDGERVRSLDDALASFRKRLGAHHPGVERIRALAEYVSSLAG